ncbi:MAG: MtrB/PioB family decaheme-associated outer membrane protein [Pseudomonadota bacterium]
MNKIVQSIAWAIPIMALFNTGRAMADDAEIVPLITSESTISVGLGDWTDLRHQQGIFDGMRDDGVYGLLGADMTKRLDANGTWFTLTARNLGLNNRDIRADYLRQNAYGGFLEYSQTARENPYTINTRLQGIGSTVLTIDTAPGSFAPQEIKLGTTRALTHVGGFKNLVPGLDMKIDFKNENKTGTRQWGWGSAALFSVEPLDSTTRQLELLLQFTGKQLQLAGGYLGSWYDNHHLQVLEQLNGVTGGTNASFNSVTPMSLPLRNHAHQIFLDGGYSLTTATRGTAKFAYSRAIQNEHLPSYDLTGANAPFVNAPAQLNGRIDTLLAQLGLNSRPFSTLSMTANLRYFDLKDKTPLAGFVGNNTTGVASVYNTPHSYKKRTAKLEATYHLPQHFNLTGGADYTDQNRSYPTAGSIYVPFRIDINELNYWMQMRRLLANSLNGSIAILRSDRDGSPYIAANGTPPYSDQINPIHIADRQRDKIRAALDWAPLEKFSMQFRFEQSQDKYPDGDRPYGLKDGSAQLYSVDGNYAISQNWTLAAWYSYDMTKARQLGFRQASTGAADALRDTHLKDVGDALGVNLRGKLTAHIETGVSLDWFNSTGSYPQELTLSGAGTDYPTGAVGPLPDIKNSLIRLKLGAKYAYNKNTDFHLDVIHERWRTDDWSWNFANGTPFEYYSGNINCTGCSTTPVNILDGTTVTTKKQQISNFIGLRYVYRFQ